MANATITGTTAPAAQTGTSGNGTASTLTSASPEVLSPKQAAIKAIASWALAAFAEEVTRRTGKDAGSKWEDLKTFRQALGISESTSKTVVTNDRKVAATKALASIRGEQEAVMLAEEYALLPEIAGRLKAALAELKEADKVDTAATSLRALELNCTGGQSYSYSTARIKDIKDGRYADAYAKVSGMKAGDFAAVGAEVEAAMTNAALLTELVNKDVRPIEARGRMAVAQAAVNNAEEKRAAAQAAYDGAEDADKARLQIALAEANGAKEAACKALDALTPNN